VVTVCVLVASVTMRVLVLWITGDSIQVSTRPIPLQRFMQGFRNETWFPKRDLNPEQQWDTEQDPYPQWML
jgi:hypothetical protein